MKGDDTISTIPIKEKWKIDILSILTLRSPKHDNVYGHDEYIRIDISIKNGLH